MNLALASLETMTVAMQSIGSSALSRRVNSAHWCSRLLGVADALRKRAAQKPAPKPPLDAEKVWSAWRARRFDPTVLNSLQIRTLCVSEKMALRSEWVSFLRSHIEVLQRSSCLLGLIFAYYAHWRKPATASDAEDVILKALRLYKGKNPQLRRLSQEAVQLFSPAAASYLAGEAVQQLIGPAEPISRRGLSPTTGLGEAVAQVAIAVWIKGFEGGQARMTEASAIEQGGYAVTKLLRPETPRESFYGVVRSLILSSWGDKSDRFRKDLQAFLRNHRWVGDPRLPMYSANWAALGQTATRRFLAWLARDGIIFFFNYILPDNHENRRRKDFWLEYYNSIRDFQVAVCEPQYYRLRSDKERNDILAYSRVKHATVSVFMMAFECGGKEYVVVEFSETGNAAYIYERQSFNKVSGGIRNPEFELRRLKDDSRLDRIVHRGDWEWHARQTLSYLGIRPLLTGSQGW